LITVRARDQRSVRRWCAADVATFIDGWAALVSAGADRLPTDLSWINGRRRVWFVLLLWVGLEY